MPLQRDPEVAEKLVETEARIWDRVSEGLMSEEDARETIDAIRSDSLFARIAIIATEAE